jgi:hypothetical protein
MKTMKYLTGVIVLAALAASAPLPAQAQWAQTQTSQNDAAPADKTDTNGGAVSSDAKPKTGAVKKAEKPKKPKPAADHMLSVDGTASTTDEPKHEPKKPGTVPVKHSSAVPAVVHEGGKTCSGQDEYRVCW